jgi:hypothetical protein
MTTFIAWFVSAFGFLGTPIGSYLSEPPSGTYPPRHPL